MLTGSVMRITKDLSSISQPGAQSLPPAGAAGVSGTSGPVVWCVWSSWRITAVPLSQFITICSLNLNPVCDDNWDKYAKILTSGKHSTDVGHASVNH